MLSSRRLSPRAVFAQLVPAALVVALLLAGCAAEGVDSGEGGGSEARADGNPGSDEPVQSETETGDSAAGSLLCAEMVSADDLSFYFEGTAPVEEHFEQETRSSCRWKYEDLDVGESRDLKVNVLPAEGDLVPENFAGPAIYIEGLGSHAQQLFEPPNVGFLAVGDRLARVAFYGSGGAPVDETALERAREIAVRLAGVTDDGEQPTPLILDCSKVQEAAVAATGHSFQPATSDDDAVCAVEAGEVNRDYLMVTVSLVRPKAPRDAGAWSESGETVTMRPELGPESFTAGRVGSGCLALHPGLEVMVVPLADAADDMCPASVEIASQLLADI